MGFSLFEVGLVDAYRVDPKVGVLLDLGRVAEQVQQGVDGLEHDNGFAIDGDGLVVAGGSAPGVRDGGEAGAVVQVDWLQGHLDTAALVAPETQDPDGGGSAQGLVDGIGSSAHIRHWCCGRGPYLGHVTDVGSTHDPC